MLGPADGVAERRGLLAPGVLADGLGDLEEGFLRAAGHALDHLRGVPGEVTLEDLERATGVLERWVVRARPALMHPRLTSDLLALEAVLASSDGGVVDGMALVAPARRVVLLLLLVPAREEARDVRVLEVLGDESGGVGVVDHVLPEISLI